MLRALKKTKYKVDNEDYKLIHKNDEKKDESSKTNSKQNTIQAYVMRENAVVPLFWMAPESITPNYRVEAEDLKDYEYARYYTEKTDVWSFAITCWEILTNAKQDRRPTVDRNQKISDGYINSPLRLHFCQILLANLTNITEPCDKVYGCRCLSMSRSATMNPRVRVNSFLSPTIFPH